MSWLDEVRWDRDGLAPAIAQDFRTGCVLMLAWMNREALELTAREGRGIYWSRSRQKLWRKGEESGHVQKLHELRLDCDGDAIILQVEQLGGIACHTGRASCFYRRYENGQWINIEPVLKAPDAIYAKKEANNQVLPCESVGDSSLNSRGNSFWEESPADSLPASQRHPDHFPEKKEMEVL